MKNLKNKKEMLPWKLTEITVWTKITTQNKYKLNKNIFKNHLKWQNGTYKIKAI